MAAQEVLLVTTPEPTALVDAYAMVKVVHLRDPHKPLWLLVNNAQSQDEAEETIEQLQAAALGPGAALGGPAIAREDTLTKGRICCILERP